MCQETQSCGTTSTPGACRCWPHKPTQCRTHLVCLLLGHVCALKVRRHSVISKDLQHTHSTEPAGCLWLTMFWHSTTGGIINFLMTKKRQWTKSVSLSLFFLPATTGSALCASLLFAAVPNRQCQVQDAVQLPHCHYQPVLCVVLLHRVDRTSYVP
jgi:hypothetical protein